MCSTCANDDAGFSVEWVLLRVFYIYVIVIIITTVIITFGHGRVRPSKRDPQTLFGYIAQLME